MNARLSDDNTFGVKQPVGRNWTFWVYLFSFSQIHLSSLELKSVWSWTGGSCGVFGHQKNRTRHFSRTEWISSGQMERKCPCTPRLYTLPGHVATCILTTCLACNLQRKWFANIEKGESMPSDLCLYKMHAIRWPLIRVPTASRKLLGKKATQQLW